MGHRVEDLIDLMHRGRDGGTGCRAAFFWDWEVRPTGRRRSKARSAYRSRLSTACAAKVQKRLTDSNAVIIVAEKDSIGLGRYLICTK